MRLPLLLLPLAVMGLAACVDMDEQPPVQHETTVVTPAPTPAPPAATYVAPGSGTTIVTHH